MGIIKNRPENRVPLWFMRQAGRYMAHYRAIKDSAGGDFIKMCKDVQLATEITMGPIAAYDFDAAILFSDILFPLEQLGLGLSYGEGGKGPRLERRITSLADVQAMRACQSASDYYQFQRDAVASIRQKLPAEKDLIGFVGGAWTLFAYAVHGMGEITAAEESKLALYDDRFKVFMEKLAPNLLESMLLQVAGGANAVAMFDTSAGELAYCDYEQFVFPVLATLFKSFRSECQCRYQKEVSLIYYMKHATYGHLDLMKSVMGENDVVGIDWRFPIGRVLRDYGKHFLIQGNIDPSWLLFPWPKLERALGDYWQEVKLHAGKNLERWVCGLGHGVLKESKEEVVGKAVHYIKGHYCF
ncbi:MAG: hypothetical protein HQK50_05465 [Oligoflexia bacterium]|nr:hypothetical protein [Oligoflexia bacterium]MBF0364997.1 hypothetical protein [Oligoflexia bacterium]